MLTYEEVSIVKHNADETDQCTGKLLPALKCLKAVQELDASHPGLKERDQRYKTALSSAEKLPPKVREVVDALYPLKVSS